MHAKTTKERRPATDPTGLRKQTRDWLTQRTIPNLREIAVDLENTGEDVRDLLEAINELERLVRSGPRKAVPAAGKSKG